MSIHEPSRSPRSPSTSVLLLRLAAVVFAGLTVLSCTERTAPTDAGPAGSYGFANGPSNPGPVVVRLNGVEVLGADNDPSRGLFALSTPTVDNPFCGGAALLGQVDIQRVFSPSAVGQFVGHQTSDGLHVAVYSTADFDEVFDSDFPIHTTRFCSFISGPKKIAEGTARLEQIIRFGAKEFQVSRRMEGFLEYVTGGAAHFTNVQVGVTKEQGVVFVQEDIRLKPVP
jgi:hypothetical protein